MPKLAKDELAAVIKWLQMKIESALDSGDMDSYRLFSALLFEAHVEALEAV